MKQVIQKLAGALVGHRIRVFPRMKQIEKSRLRDLRGLPGQMLHGAAGNHEGVAAHMENDVAIVAFHNVKIVNPEHVLETRLHGISEVLARHGIKAVYTIPIKGKYALITLSKAGALGWFGRRSLFVMALKRETGR